MNDRAVQLIVVFATVKLSDYAHTHLDLIASAVICYHLATQVLHVRYIFRE